MHKVTVNTTENYMILTLKGFMQEQELQTTATEVLAGADRLTPGFTVINDISEFKPATHASAVVPKDTQAAIFRKGIGKVIRVEGEAAVANMQFTRTQREAKATYEVLYAATLDEALTLL